MDKGKNMHKKSIAMAVIIIMFSFLFLFPGSINATVSQTQIWSENIKLSYEAVNPIYGSSIFVDGNNIYVVWSDERYHTPPPDYSGDIEIFFKKSNDGGKTWTDDMRLTNDSNKPAGEYWHGDTYPEIAVNMDDIYIVWTRNIGERDFANVEMFYKQSSDGGGTWGENIQLTFRPSSTSNEAWVITNPDIVVDNNNNVHVVWCGNDERIYYMKSMDNGKTWTTPTPLSDSVSAFPSMAYSNSTIHMIYTAPDDHICYRKSNDNGNTWSEKIKLGHSKYKGRLAAENMGTHVVYYDDRDDEKNVYYIRSTNNGETWHQEVKLVNYPSFNPDITVNGNNVSVVWCDLRDWGITGCKEVYYKRSMNNGVDWENDVPLTSNLGDSSYPRVTSQGWDSYVLFSNYNFTEDWCYVYFKRTVPYAGFLSGNISKPILNVVSPKRWDTVDGIIEISGTAESTNSDTTIQKVEIKIDPDGEWEIVSGTTNWSYTWDTTNVSNGKHTIFVRAYDGGSYSEPYVLPLYVRTKGGGLVPFDMLPLLRICGMALTIVVATVGLAVLIWYVKSKHHN